MRNVFIFICLLTFLSCEKMEVTPEYSFVRLNDDDPVPPCGFGEDDCLPAYLLDDIAFQLITDFDDAGANFAWLLALPCDDCSDFLEQDVFDNVFGAQRLPLLVTQNLAGKFGTITTEFDTLPQVGQYIYVADPLFYQGYHLIQSVEVLAGSPILIKIGTTTDYLGVAHANATVGVTSANFIYADTYFQNSDGNYIWTFNNYYNTAISYTDGSCFRLCVYDLKPMK